MSGTDSTHSGKVLVQLLNEITVVRTVARFWSSC